MFNYAILSGRLTDNPELKITNSGVYVCSFTIAVERKYKQGEEKQADFINIQTWRKTAEFVSKYFQKGSMIGIEGSIQTRKYKDKDGKNRTAFEVVANDVHFMESKRSETSDPLDSFESKLDDFQEIQEDVDLPFN